MGEGKQWCAALSPALCNNWGSWRGAQLQSLVQAHVQKLQGPSIPAVFLYCLREQKVFPRVSLPGGRPGATGPGVNISKEREALTISKSTSVSCLVSSPHLCYFMLKIVG